MYGEHYQQRLIAMGMNLKGLEQLRYSLTRFNEAAQSAIQRGMIQIVSRPNFRQLTQFLEDEERKGLPKKPRHHDHLLQRHIRSPQPRDRRP
jgi:hypothetical protein